MKFVIDSSVMVKWVLAEPDSDRALKLRDNLRNSVDDLLSPDLFTVEAAHALTRAERQLLIPVGQARALLLDILTTPPQVYPFQPFLLRAIDIASTVRIGVYDCIYVTLAEQQRCELVTADTTLVRVLQPTVPFIRTLASFS
jgi:predicted nucleic acid-binding protein